MVSTAVLIVVEAVDEIAAFVKGLADFGADEAGGTSDEDGLF
jgi:hypothetical protein